MKKLILLFLLLGAACLTRAQEEQVLFSSNGGFYENSFQLSLECVYSNHHIRYTTNGNNPTATSFLYEAPLTLGPQLYSHSNIYTIQISPEDLIYVPDSVRHAIVIRAAVFDENDSCVSKTVTNTYLIHDLGFDSNGMAVVSICADSLALFDYETGIFVPGVHFNPDAPLHSGNYYQKGREWERLSNVEFYEPNDNSSINQTCGLRTHGNLSRRHPAKGMKIYAREEYGTKRFNHDFFQDTTLTSFKHLIIKPCAVFEPYSGAQDYFSVNLARQLNVESPHCRPVIAFLNGEYWGVYFIQEKTDERFLEDHFDINPDLCNIIGSWKGEVENGNNLSFQQMMQWFSNADLADDAVYEQACKIIDIDNFIDYYVVETFVGNWDWPGNNTRCWQIGDGRWRWIFFDGDATLMGGLDVFERAAIYEPPTTWINYPEAKLLFGKMVQNAQFRTAFSNRASELCNGLFLYENTSPLLNDLIETLRPKIQDQRHRFGYPPTDELWNHGNAVLNNFLSNRTTVYLEIMESFFKNYGTNEWLPEPDSFTCFPNPTNGIIQIQVSEKESQGGVLNIYDIHGALVFKESLPPSSPGAILSIHPKLPTGIYCIIIGNSTQRIVIQ